MQLPLEAGGPEVVVSVSSEDSDPSDLSSSLSSDLSPPATTSRQDRQAAWLRSVQQSRTSEMEFVTHKITLTAHFATELFYTLYSHQTGPLPLHK